jgi:hypothetical protein
MLQGGLLLNGYAGVLICLYVGVSMTGLQKFPLCSRKSGAWTEKNLFMMEWPGFFVASGLNVIGQLDER